MEVGNFSQALEEFSSCLEARKAVLPTDSRSIAEAHFLKSRAEAALGKIGDSEISIKAAISVLEERTVNLGKMELSPHLVEEIADLEGLGIDLEEILVEFKEGMTEHTKRKLSAGSPSAKLAGVEKAPRIDRRRVSIQQGRHSSAPNHELEVLSSQEGSKHNTA